MNKLQKAELDILKEIIKILEKYEIKYYILGGTLLGAVRHQGFIPWDDDIDIGLMREDYEKFIEIIQKELPENLILDYYKFHKGEKEYTTYYMARIENTEVKLINRTAKEERIVNAWVDIFPIDGLPKNKLINAIHKFHLLILRAELRYSQYSKLVTQNERTKDFIMRLCIKLGRIIDFEKIFNKDKVLDKIDRTLKKYPTETANEIINFAGACKSYKFIEIFPKNIYDNLKKYKFEDTELVGAENYDYILSHQYGEYMVLPKEEDRNKHSTEIIEE